MKRALSIIGVLQTSLIPSTLSAQGNSAAPPLAITHVTVIDVEKGGRLQDQTVLIAGGRIRALGNSSSVPLPGNAQVVDARGKFAIPGLWDMHVHGLVPPLVAHSLPLMVAHGVTGVRDMWGSLETAAQVRRDVSAERRIAPRFIVAGNLVDGAPPTYDGAAVADSPARGRAVVDSLARSGSAFIKVYSKLSPETFSAIADEAKRVGISFAGHVPIRVRAADASDRGQRTLEHLSGVLEGCSREEQAAIEQRILSSDTARRDAATQRGIDHRYLVAVVDGFDAARCDALLRRFIRNETWIVPTQLVVMGALLPRRAEQLAPNDRFVPAMLRHAWARSISGYEQRDSVVQELLSRFWNIRERIVARMAALGVPVLAGSDDTNPFVVPGFALHAELRLLVQAGLTPLQALQSATINPARFLAATDSLGSIGGGKVADLVLLDADPLANIANTQKIRAVLLGGRYLDRVTLDRLLADAEEAANSQQIDPGPILPRRERF